MRLSVTAEMVTIQVPQTLYDRLERLARLTHRPVESLIAQTLSTSLPLLPDDLPVEQREALAALESLSDEQLWQVEGATFPESQYERFAELREKSRNAGLTPSEQATLDQLSTAADLLTLRKAYAAVLLKWRGHRLPSLAALESA
jgi:hypothetical protein